MPRRLACLVLGVAVAVPACGGDGSGTEVAAAASLTDVLDDLDDRLDLRVNANGSAVLARQLLDGLDADVFLAADAATMALVAEAGLLDGPPVVFATNHLVVAVPAGNPGAVRGLADVGRSDLRVGLCARPVPCGALAHAELAAVGVEPAADTEEPNVRSLLAKLRSGELDVALVYATDVAAAGDDLEVVAELSRPTEYLAGVLRNGDVAAGRAMIDVLVGSGREALTAAGFGVP